MTIHTFNTGRMYTTEGQRIAYTETQGDDMTATVVFYDYDRGVNGEVTLVRPVTDARLLLAYDRSHYGYSSDYALLDQLKAAAAAVAPWSK